MEILVIYSNNDQAGVSIVKKLIENNDFEKEESNKNEIYKKNNLRIISTDKDLVNINDLSPFNADMYVFASRHKAEKGKPTLSAHFTGNFSSEARLGGNGKEIAISFPGLLKDYMKNLWNLKNEIKEFNIVIIWAPASNPRANIPNTYNWVLAKQKRTNRNSINCFFKQSFKYHFR